jgi:hypothetical protein
MKGNEDDPLGLLMHRMSLQDSVRGDRLKVPKKAVEGG